MPRYFLLTVSWFSETHYAYRASPLFQNGPFSPIERMNMIFNKDGKNGEGKWNTSVKKAAEKKDELCKVGVAKWVVPPLPHAHKPTRRRRPRCSARSYLRQHLLRKVNKANMFNVDGGGTEKVKEVGQPFLKTKWDKESEFKYMSMHTIIWNEFVYMYIVYDIFPLSRYKKSYQITVFFVM